MTQGQYIINRKLNIMELGATLGNISDACRKLGISRQHYYDIKTAIAEEGLEGLWEKSRRAPPDRQSSSPGNRAKTLSLFYGIPYPWPDAHSK